MGSEEGKKPKKAGAVSPDWEADYLPNIGKRLIFDWFAVVGTNLNSLKEVN